MLSLFVSWEIELVLLRYCNDVRKAGCDVVFSCEVQ